MNRFLIPLAVFVFFQLILLLNITSAADWHVRPYGGNYGNEDGSSYDNAWEGLSSVVWGSGGVQPGDNLYVCGLHLRTRTGGSAWQVFSPQISGTPGARITIRGDCPNNDDGIVWGAGIMDHEPWIDESGGVWSITEVLTPNDMWYFEDITNDNWTVLKKMPSLEECMATPGSYYSLDYNGGSRFYVHTSDGQNPTGRIAANRLGYHMVMNDKHYINWHDLKFYSIYRWVEFGTNYGIITNQRWENCTFWYGEHSFFLFRNYNAYNEFIDCEFAYSKNGIGFAETPIGSGSSPIGDGSEPHDMLVSGCTFHHIGLPYGDSDAHAISGQGCRNIIMEKNHIYLAGSGITFYVYNTNQSAKNLTIRYNWIHDTHTNGGANSRGIELNTGPGQAPGTTANVYGNIVGPNVSDVCYRDFWIEPGEFYNNVAYDCGTSFYIHHHLFPVNAIIKNSISMNPRQYHIRYSNNNDSSVTSLNSDYNIFYPVGTDNFFIYVPEERITDLSFSEWQALSIPRSTFDTHSIYADPMFVDPQGGNFSLQSGSPAIDMGIDAGLSVDYDGNPIPMGSAPDIGAIEYQGAGNVFYVRPAGGSYGSEDGSSYTNAWNGLHDIDWSQINPGDTFYICGTHLVQESGGITETKHDITIAASGSPGNPITMRGDCPGDEGVIWGTWIDNSRTWTDEGGGTYSTTTQAGMGHKYILEDINGASYTKLTERGSIQDVKDNPGSYYNTDWSHAGGTFYVHTTDGGNPDGRIAFTTWGYQLWPQAGSTDIDFKNLKWYGIYRFMFPPGNNLRWSWEDCKFHIATNSEIFSIYDNNHYFTWENCTFEYSQTAIYTHSATNNAPSYGTVRNCVITEQGTDQHGPGGDNHGLGIQGGHDWLIEYNDISKCNEGIVFYLDETQDSYNNVIRYNYIHDINDQGNAFGISFGCDTNSGDADHSGNRIYNNIIAGNQRAGGRGLYWKWSEPPDFYNNVIYNFDIGVRTNGPADFSGEVKLRNNIILNTGTYIFYILGRAPGSYIVDSDYNIFYPATGNQFYLKDNEGEIITDFNGWKSMNRPGFTLDPNSLTSDPLFMNLGSHDFRLQSGSPAIDSGVFVGLTQDYAGNPVPQGNGTDIGAHEFASGICSIEGDLNIDCKVNLLDLQVVTMDFGRTSGYDSRADIVVDGEIDIFDVVYVASRFT